MRVEIMKINTKNQPVRKSGFSTTSTLFAAIAALAMTLVQSEASPLRAGDIVYADSFAAVIRIDAATGQSNVLASGGNLVMPYGVAQDPQGNILVSDTGSQSIVRISARNGRQTTV